MKNKTIVLDNHSKEIDYLKNFENCIFNHAMQVIGGKWKPIILYYIKSGANRFGMLQRAIPIVSKQMLTSQLRELEESGLINRKIYAEVPPRVEYSISKKGETVFPVLEAIEKWGREQKGK